MIWWVHRNAAGAIIFAAQYEQPDYAQEKLDDATSAELQAYRAVATAVAQPKLTPLQWLKRLSPAKQQAVFTTALQAPALLGSLFMADGVGPGGIDVTDPQTIALVAAWVQIGTLDATDQATLLAP